MPIILLTAAFPQGVAKEELGKETIRAEELMKAKSALESTSARLTSQLKAFTEKSEKVHVLF